MYEDALSFTFLGMQVFYYGLYAAIGAALALGLLAILSRRMRLPAGTVALFGVLALPLSIACGRLLFCLLDFRFHSYFSLRALLSFWGGGLSMTGVLLGAVGAACLTARIQGVHTLAFLDLLAPALLLFIAFARIGEQYTELLGRSRPLVMEGLKNSFLASSDGYDAYLKTYLFEAVTALALSMVMLFLLRRSLPHGDVLLIGMLLLGCTQVLWESLRFDAHMRQSFISMQQILYACMFAAPLLIYAARAGRKMPSKRPLVCSIALLVLLTAAIIGLEFMIDRSGISRLLLYLVYALLLSLPAVLALTFRKRSLK